MEFTEPKAPFKDFKTELTCKTLYKVEEMETLFEGVQKFSFDTETSGLNPLQARVIGFSFSTDGKSGYYIPLKHKEDKNADPKCLDFIVDKIKSCKCVLMYGLQQTLYRMQPYILFIVHH